MPDDQSQPRNRRGRRNAARAAGTPPSSPPTSDSGFDIPMALPDLSGPKGKTLYEIAEERMRELQQTAGHRKGEASGVLGHDGEQPELGAAAEALLYAFTLTALHLTLDVLVHHQYREHVDWAEIRSRSARVAPLLWLVVYLAKTATAMRLGCARQGLLCVAAVGAGCYCVYIGNTFGYYAVMKRAPPVGVLWVWTVVEMRLPYAAASLAAVLAYTWWNGFGLY